MSDVLLGSQDGGDHEQSVPDWARGRYKVIHDPVHKYTTLTDEVLSVVDTPQFQRLRELKQLGTVYYVFPGAAHNRFEHSIGVSWLSGLMIDHLAATQPSLHVTDAERAAVRVAGAVHDLGHGPLSHVFDGLFIPLACPGVRWRHEDMSLALLDLLIEENDVHCLDDDGMLDMVKKMVTGVKGGAGSAAAASLAPSPREERPFLYEIVANGISGIDTDKFDYILRDTHNVGMTTAFDYRRLLYGSRVMADGHIGFHVKEAGTAYELFHTRHQLFRQIYVHRATKAIEYMITDVLLEADAAWGRRLSAAIHDPAEYCRLTDNVIFEIEHVGRADPRLARAHGILRDLRRRRLYRFVDEYLVPQRLEAVIPTLRAEDIAGYNANASLRLDPANIIVHDAVFNYGKGASNPVDAVTFFRDATDDVGGRVRREKISHMLPTAFQERIIRVYSKCADEAVVAAVQAAFRRCLRMYNPTAGLAPDPNSRVFANTSLLPPDTTLLAASPDSLVVASDAFGQLGELDRPPRREGVSEPPAEVAAPEQLHSRMRTHAAATPSRASSAAGSGAGGSVVRAASRGRLASPATAAIHGNSVYVAAAASSREGTPHRQASDPIPAARGAVAALEVGAALRLAGSRGARAPAHPPPGPVAAAVVEGALELGSDGEAAAGASHAMPGAGGPASVAGGAIGAARPPLPHGAAKRYLPPQSAGEIVAGGSVTHTTAATTAPTSKRSPP